MSKERTHQTRLFYKSFNQKAISLKLVHKELWFIQHRCTVDSHAKSSKKHINIETYFERFEKKYHLIVDNQLIKEWKQILYDILRLEKTTDIEIRKKLFQYYKHQSFQYLQWFIQHAWCSIHASLIPHAMSVFTPGISYNKWLKLQKMKTYIWVEGNKTLIHHVPLTTPYHVLYIMETKICHIPPELRIIGNPNVSKNIVNQEYSSAQHLRCDYYLFKLLCYVYVMLGFINVLCFKS